MSWETTENEIFKYSKNLYVEVMDYDKLGSEEVLSHLKYRLDMLR